jgi:hypothetical protein
VITADNITDEQIRELKRHAELNIDNENRWWHANQPLWTDAGEHNHDLLIGEYRRTVQTCEAALYDIHSVGADARRAKARARCAEILDARAAKSAGGE